MVRLHTFAGLVAVTFVAVKSLDNLVVWMADAREAKLLRHSRIGAVATMMRFLEWMILVCRSNYEELSCCLLTEQLQLERRAAQMRRQLIKEMQEREASQ